MHIFYLIENLNETWANMRLIILLLLNWNLLLFEQYC